MAIGAEDVKHVAQLARLDLEDAEITLYTEQLNDILQYAQKINELDTSNVEPTSHVMPLINVTREDVPHRSSSLEQVFRNAPDEEEGHFKVPAVIE